MMREREERKKKIYCHRHTNGSIDQETNNKYIQCHKYNMRQLDMFNHIIGYLQKLWNDESYYVSLARRHYQSLLRNIISLRRLLSFFLFSLITTKTTNTTTFISLNPKVQARTTNLWPSWWAEIMEKIKKRKCTFISPIIYEVLRRSFTKTKGANCGLSQSTLSPSLSLSIAPFHSFSHFGQI